MDQATIWLVIVSFLVSCTFALWYWHQRRSSSGVVDRSCDITCNPPAPQVEVSKDETLTSTARPVEESLRFDGQLFKDIWSAVEEKKDVLPSPSPLRRRRVDSPVERLSPSSSSDSDFPEEEVRSDLSPQELALVALINFGEHTDLKELKGIGAKSADAILAYRAKGLQFTCLDDLVKAGLNKTVKQRLLNTNR